MPGVAFNRLTLFENVIDILKKETATETGPEKRSLNYLFFGLIYRYVLNHPNKAIEAFMAAYEENKANITPLFEAIYTILDNYNLFEKTKTDLFTPFQKIFQSEIKDSLPLNKKNHFYFLFALIWRYIFPWEEGAKKSIRLIPSQLDVSPVILLLKESLRVKENDWPGLIPLFTGIIEKGADDRLRNYLYLKIGYIYHKRLNDKALALKYYQKYLEKNPNYLPVIDLLIDLTRDTNEIEALADLYNRKALLINDPEEKGFLSYKSAQLLENRPQATDQNDALYQKSSRIRTNIIQREQIKVNLIRQGEYDQVIPILEEELALRKDDPQILVSKLYQLATLYAAAQKPNKELEYYRKILKLSENEELAFIALYLNFLENPEAQNLILLLESKTLNKFSAFNDFDRQLLLDLANLIATRSISKLKGLLWGINSVLEDPYITTFFHHVDFSAQTGEFLLEKKGSFVISDTISARISSKIAECKASSTQDDSINLINAVSAAYAYGNSVELESLLANFSQTLKETLPQKMLSGELHHLKQEFPAFIDFLLGLNRYFAQDNEFLLKEIAQVYSEELHDRQGAISIYQRLIRGKSSKSPYVALFEQFLRKEQDFKSLITLYEKLIPETADSHEKARLLYQLGQIQDQHFNDKTTAKKYYQDALACGTKQPEALKALTNIYLEAKDWENYCLSLAEELALLKEPGQRFSLLIALGEIAEVQLKQKETALKYYQEAHQIKPADTVLIEKIERLFREAKQFEALTALLKEKLTWAKTPDQMAKILKELGLIQIREYNDPKSGRQYLQDAKSQGYQESDLFWELYQLNVADQQHEEAINTLKELEEIEPDNGEKSRINFLVGEIYYLQIGEIEEATYSYDKALNYSPQNRAALNRLEEIFSKTKDNVNLTNVYEKMLLIEDSKEKQIEILNQLIAISQEDTKMISIYKKMLSLSGEQVTLIETLSELQRNKGKWLDLYENLIKLLQITTEATRKNEIFSEISNLIEVVRDEKRDFQRDIEILSKQALNEADLDILVLILINIEDYPAVLKVIQKELQLTDLSAEKKFQLFLQAGILCQERLSDTAQAQLFFQAAADLDPQNITPLKYLISIYEETGNYLSAYQMNKELLKQMATNKSKRQVLDTLLSYAKKIPQFEPGEEIFLYEKLFEAGDFSENILNNLTRVYTEKGDYEKLIELFRHRIEKSSHFQEIIDTYYKLGDIYFNKLYNIDQAITAYIEIIKIAPNEKPAIMRLITLYNRQGDIATLIPLYDKYIELEEDTTALAKAFYRKGEAYFKLSQWIEAIREYENSLKIDRNNLLAINRLHQLYAKVGEYPKLVDILQMMLEFDAANAADYEFELGEIYLNKLNQLDKAYHCFQKVILAKKEHGPSLKYLYNLHVKNKNFEEAVNTLKKLESLSEDPMEKSEISLKIGKILERCLFKSLEAYHYYIRSFNHHLANVDSLSHIERLGSGIQDWKTLINCYLQHVELIKSDSSKRPQFENILTKVADIYLNQLDDPSNALIYYLKLLEAFPQNNRYLEKVKEFYLEKNRYPELIALFKSMTKKLIEPEIKDRLVQEIYEIHKNRLDTPDQGAQYLEEILVSDKLNPYAINSLEIYYQDRGQWEELNRILQLKLKLAMEGDDTIDIQLKMGDILRDKIQDNFRAMEAFKKVLRMAPGNLNALRALSHIYEMNEEWDKLIELTQKELNFSVNPEEKAYLFFRLGYLYETVKTDLDKAISYYKTALHKAFCVPALSNLKDIYRRLKQWDRLIDCFKMELDNTTDIGERSTILSQIGDEYEQGPGLYLEALSNYEKGIQEDPANLIPYQGAIDLYLKLKEWDKAQGLINQLLTSTTMFEEREQGYIYYKSSQVALLQKEYLKAYEYLHKAITCDPANLSALAQFIEIAAIVCKPLPLTDNLNNIEKRLQEENDEKGLIELYLIWGGYCEQHLEIDSALHFYDKSIEKDPQKFGPYAAKANLLVRLLKYEEALKVIDQFLLTKKGSDEKAKRTELANIQEANALKIRALEVKGDLWLNRLEKPQKALQCFNAMLELDPNSLVARYKLAQSFFWMKRWGEALKQMEDLLEHENQLPADQINAKDFSAHYLYLGKILEIGFHNLDAALLNYQKGAEIARGNSEIYRMMANIYFEKKDFHNWEQTYYSAINTISEEQGEKETIEIRKYYAEKYFEIFEYGKGGAEYQKIAEILGKASPD